MNRTKDTKPHIGIFGRRNNGKSSIINTLVNQEIAIVSDFAGTTTDPVKKSIEIAGIGPAIIIDTAGIDDVGDLGKKRVQKTKSILKTIDFAILVIIHNQWEETEINLAKELNEYAVPYIIVHNKSDLEELGKTLKNSIKQELDKEIIAFDTVGKENKEALVQAIKEGIPESAYISRSLIGNLVKHGDIVLLITPIDIEAPEGRMILPQVQSIRDILDNDCIAVICKEKEVDTFIRKMQPKPALAITDSQIFLKADASIPKDIPLTGFSVILAHQKGDFDNYLKGTPHISQLKNNDRILILESCTHHVSCDDIGRVKIPRWLSGFTGKNLEYDVVTGLNDLARDIKDYALVIQCGGCVLTRKQVINRLKPAVDAGIPVTNYGMAIAYIQGIYNRAVAPFIQITKEEYL